ncbi:hypothetical protein [Ancylomarina longa]|uniref:Uncharacterized protein n=1 Tax=Ancylomarina longa TaxID=2487017 RepID=A0A434AXB9_9BACT|nr:hypothetical protein [Ancylomarina longa]RUT79186.1 hypothetical protein DLK05_05045 [Ancylomarina longa]
MTQFQKEESNIGKIEKETAFQKLFQSYLKLKQSLKDYHEIFSEKKYDSSLRKTLNYGEISGIEYLMESIYYYDSFDTYLKIEHEYYKTAAKIQKYQL